jgi:alpha-2-macroglobulin
MTGEDSYAYNRASAAGPNRALLVVALVLWLGLMAGALVAREPATAQLEGVVVAKETGQPIAEANVAAHGEGWEWQEEVETDAQGRFRLENIGTGRAYISGYTHIHKSLKDMRIEVKEGSGNRVRLELDPVPPYLHLQTHQHTLLPDEKAVLTCKGFFPADTVRLEVRRITLPDLIEGNEDSSPGDDGVTVPPGKGELVQSKEIAAQPRDPEGLFFKTLSLQQPRPGLYSVWVRTRGARAGTVLSVSRVGVITKSDHRSFLAYAVDLETDRPVPGALATFHHGAEVMAQGTTGSDGLFRTPAVSMDRGVSPRCIVKAGDSVAFTRMDTPWGGEEQGEYRTYLYTDRPVYRPGQVVNFKGIVRQKRGPGYRVPASLPVKLEIHDPSDSLLRKASYTTSDFGSFHGWFRLPAGGAIGAYRVTLDVGGDNPSFYFHVAEYRKPEYKVEVTPERPRLLRGEEARVAVTATYFWGGPVRQARVSYRVTREVDYVGPPMEDEDLAEYYPTPWGAREGDEGEEGGYGDYGEDVATGELTTDDAGRVLVRFATDMPERDTEDYRYVVSVDVTDPSRRTVSEERSVQVARSPLRLFVEPESWVLAPGATARVDVTAVDYLGKPRPGLSVHMTAVGREGDVVTDAKGRATWTVPEGRLPGAFQVSATAQDERRQRVEASTWLWTGTGDFSAAGYNYADLEVVADRKMYEAGDTARLVLNTAHPGTAALLTVEGDRLYEARVVDLKERSTVVELPVLPDYRPNVYISVSSVHKKTYARKEVELRVSPRQQQLTVQVTADKPRYGPRDTAVYTIRTLDARGRPVDAEASLGLVDESIYSVMAESRFDALQAFYRFRSNAVQTNFSFPEIYLAGDAKDEGPGEVRKEFPDTATWLPVIRTGADGKAVVKVRLPDTLTTWRATVRGHTTATQVGSGISKVIATKPLLVRLETPRFFTQNDETTIAAVVHNETERPERITVRLKADGLMLNGSTETTLDVPAHGVARQDWSVVAPPGLQSILTASAQGGSGLRDAMQLTVPVVPHGSEYRSSGSGEAPGEVTATLTLPPGSIREATQARVTLAGSPAGLIMRSLTYLRSVDYGTTENIVGWFLPDMTFALALRDLGVKWPALEKDLPKRVRDNLARLYHLQTEEGGWGWGSSSPQDAFWTAYALYGLVQAKKAGYLVDESAMEQGVSALKELLPKVKDPSNRALALYVLAAAGSPDRAALQKMAGGAAKLQNYARALIVLALADVGDMSRARAVAKILEQGGKANARVAWWPEIFPWGFYSCNDNETTGYAMMALIRVDPTNVRIPRAARWLVEHHLGDRWTSSEDTASVILALSEYLRLVARQNPADLTATVLLNGTPVGTRRIDRKNFFQELSVPLPTASLRQGQNQVTIRREGTGPLLYSALLTTYVQGENLPAAASPDGLHVRREYVRRVPYRDIHGRDRNRDVPMGSTVQVGDEIIARITVRAPRAAREVLIEDPIPAGCEIMDEEETEYYEEGQYARREARDRRAVFHAYQINAGENVFEYRLRAELPGDYHILPARAACAYIPEIWGAAAERRLRIRD